MKSESEVGQWFPTLSDPMDCSLPGSSVHGIFQAGVLEWGATAFSIVCDRGALFVFLILSTRVFTRCVLKDCDSLKLKLLLLHQGHSKEKLVVLLLYMSGSEECSES